MYPHLLRLAFIVGIKGRGKNACLHFLCSRSCFKLYSSESLIHFPYVWGDGHGGLNSEPHPGNPRSISLKSASSNKTQASRNKKREEGKRANQRQPLKFRLVDELKQERKRAAFPVAGGVGGGRDGPGSPTPKISKVNLLFGFPIARQRVLLWGEFQRWWRDSERRIQRGHYQTGMFTEAGEWPPLFSSSLCSLQVLFISKWPNGISFGQ